MQEAGGSRLSHRLRHPGATAGSALRSALDERIARGDMAGLQYLLVRDGEVRLEHCAGWADAIAAQPVVPETTFNLYSITKPFTATLILELARQARFGLEEPISKVTGLSGLGQLGSVRATLLHQAGFGNPMPLRWFHLDVEDEAFDEAEFVRRVLHAQEGRARSSPRYSNLGYLALGVAADRTLGQPFREALSTQLLARLQLAAGEHLGFSPPDVGTHACGHVRRRGLLDLMLGWLVERDRIVASKSGRWVQLRRHHVDGSAYGGLIGNARGLARFGLAVLGECTAISETVRSQLLSLAPDASLPRSLGWFSGELEGQRWFAHAGGGLGGYGELRLYPRLRAVSVLLANRPGLRDRRQLDRLDCTWLAS